MNVSWNVIDILMSPPLHSCTTLSGSQALTLIISYTFILYIQLLLDRFVHVDSELLMVSVSQTEFIPFPTNASSP